MISSEVELILDKMELARQHRQDYKDIYAKRIKPSEYNEDEYDY